MADCPECPGLIPRSFVKAHEGVTEGNQCIRPRSGAKADFNLAPAGALGS